ncbi:glycerate kinase type-2 family protein [Pelagibacterium montanilacus]|uniref:glycerate kinase type-2 family protein n=1 Tax=Pelagibacterium montanilacus TaxID=2185280 RepID=UPI000F8DBF4F|nr:glycerate kinase [Pelagibacterium montanilacus]
MDDLAPRAFLTELFDAAVRAADPLEAIRANLPEPPKGRTVVIGAGKAASQMAAAFEKVWEGPFSGLVVDRHGPVAETNTIRVLQAAHPVPDAAGLDAARALFHEVAGLTEDDLVIALISGGGSALLPAPAQGLSFEDEVAVNKALLASGAPIDAMNVVRNHVSAIKGGRLALAAAPARVVSLVVSDVAGDDPAMVASGPTVPHAAGVEDALSIIAEYGMALPEAVMAHLNSGKAHAPRPDDPGLARNSVTVIASAGVSLEAAATRAREMGVEAAILSDAIEGEAREIGKMHAAIAREIATRGRPFTAPVVLLSGGETTVTIRDGYGRGGRNTEMLLSFAREIEGVAGIDALAADTDGIDGSEDNAGAFADGGSMARMRAAGVDPGALLANHDAWTAFDAAGDLFVPGPTGTNVNDLRAILVRRG